MSKRTISGLAILGSLLPGLVRAEEAPNNALPKCCNVNHCKICTTCDDPVSANVLSQSLVAKNLRYRHWAVDYAAPQSPSGCTTGCGSGALTTVESKLPALELERVLYHDTALPSSLGLNWSFTCDVWLDCYQPGQVASGRPTGVPGWQILVARPQRAPIDFYVAVDGEADGIYQDERKAYFKGLRFVDAAGAQVPSPVSAARAIFSEWDGGVWTFEMYEEATGKFMGRPVRYEDRNGNAIVHTWKYAVGDPALTGSLRAKLRIRDRITDAYGRTAVFHTDETKQAGGLYVTASIDLPNGSAISYSYDTQVNMGRGSYGGLAAVTHPDGSRSTFASSLDSPRNCVRYEVHDVAADPESRHKVVWFSTSAWIDPTNPKNVKSQIFGRARRIENGDGALSFSATVMTVDLAGGAHEDRSFFLNQGKLTAIVHHDGGAPEAVYVRDQVNDGNPLFYNLTGPRGGFNQWAGWTQEYSMVPGPALLSASAWTDALGRTTQREIDPATDQPLSVTYPDGTTQTTEYNALLQPTRRVDRLGRVTEWTYDGAGNLLARTEAVGKPEQATETWTYWSAADTVAGRGKPGQMRSHTDANGNTTDYLYSPAGDLAQVIAPADVAGGPRAVTSYARDVAGRLVQSADPAGRITRYGWDVRNRQVLTTYADGSTETVTYGVGVDANLPVARADRNGVATTLAYDLAGRLLSTIRAAGRPEAVATTTIWMPESKTLPLARTEAGSTTRFAYDSRLRLIGEQRQATANGPLLTTLHQYDAQDRRTVTADAFGRHSFLVYDLNSRVVRTVRELVPGGLPAAADPAQVARDVAPNPAYVIEETVYDAEGQVVARIDGRGVRDEFAYDARGRQIGHTVAAGTADQAIVIYRYDAAGNRTEMIGVRGQVTHMTYTGRNLLAQVVEAVGAPETATTRYAYSPTGKVASVTDALGRTSVNVYGGCCDRLVQVIDPLGFVTRFGYDFVGNRVSVVDANGLATSTVYDGRNRPVAVANAAGETTAIRYDDDLTDGAGIENSYPLAVAGLGFGPGAVGRAQTVTDPTGAVQVMAWDALGRVVRSVDALGHTTTSVHDVVVAGLVEVSTTDAVGATTRVRVDAAGRARLTIDAVGQIANAAFDANGNRVAWRDANGVGQDCVFDARDREVVCAETNGSVKRTTYDADGNRVIEVDALGAPTNHTFDLRGRRLTTRDRIGAVTAFTYDPVGNLLSITDAEAKVTRYAYDARNLLVREQFPDGQATPGGRDVRTYTYDAGHRLASRTDQAGVVTRYAYSAANRLISRQYSGGTPSDSFSYDPAGRLVRAASGQYGVDVARSYDPAGRLAREEQRIDGLDFPVSYTYDASNRLTGLTYPDGTVVTRGYSPRGELTQVTMDGKPVATRGYDAGGRLTTTGYGNGVVETRTYVPGDLQVARIAAASPAGGTAITDFRYGYDANKRKTVERDEVMAAAEQRFGYDAQDRLTAWNRTGAASSTQTWNLTVVGDWAITTRDGEVERRTHTDVHEIATIGRQRLRYDAKGNLVDAPDLPTLGWDVENRLVSALGVGPNGSVRASYRYDALGRRVQKVVNGKATTYLSVGAQTVVEVTGRLLNAPWLNPVPALVEEGLLDAQGSVMQAAGGYRLNFQPPHSDTPDGWLADEGAVYGKRGDGLFYGWNRPAWFAAERDQLDQPQWDTFVGMDFLGLYPSEWSMQLPNGTYPMIIVMGDAASRAQTNTITVNGKLVTDPTPWDGKFSTAEYEEGSFDGYALDVVVTDGRLRLKPVKGHSRNPKLCFIEFGPAGSAITQAMRDRLDAVVKGMTKATAQNHGRTPTVTRLAYGSYVDAVLAYDTVERRGTTRRYVHANHLYSPAAVTDAAGVVQERYRYSAYGEQGILTADGRARSRSKVGLGRSYTGYVSDQETGMMNARARMYSPDLGRFVGRDPWMSSPVENQRDVVDPTGRSIFVFQWGPSSADGYQSGPGLYAAYFSPNGTDPSGMFVFGTYDVEKGLLVIFDPDTGEHLVVEAESGGKPYGDPIPGGTYEILDGSSPDKYRLDPVDETPRNDEVDKSGDKSDGRDHFRLHNPGRTVGCIAVKKQEDWEKVKKMIRSTKTEEVEVTSDCWKGLSTRKEKLKKYGDVRVVPNRS